MRTANNWKDYQIIDTSSGEKLERWGETILIRPDPQIIWNTVKSAPEWRKAQARYIRSSKGGGEWKYMNKLPESWEIGYKNLRFKISPTGFKHTGLFPEQAVNWDLISDTVKNSKTVPKALNLFAYTGGATLAAAEAGAEVCHVDASKGMVSWARENARLSGLSEKPVRWIVDDCEKFVSREIKRGRRYDIVIMDPPSYGRGPSGEIWQLEQKIYSLLNLCVQVLSDSPMLFILNSYTTGLSPSVMEYLLKVTVGKKFRGKISSSEIGLPVRDSKAVLPCGNTALYQKD